ncbi:hypothetical protein C8Q78DRAFT_255580 [Trametes maxima]|nr:hypothetical protein C8Q78DRAFT_255580 [Trametes maxima]
MLSPGAVSWRCLSSLSIMARQRSRRGRTHRPGTTGLGPSEDYSANASPPSSYTTFPHLARPPAIGPRSPHPATRSPQLTATNAPTTTAAPPPRAYSGLPHAMDGMVRMQSDEISTMRVQHKHLHSSTAPSVPRHNDDVIPALELARLPRRPPPTGTRAQMNPPRTHDTQQLLAARRVHRWRDLYSTPTSRSPPLTNLRA